MFLISTGIGIGTVQDQIPQISVSVFFKFPELEINYFPCW